MPTLQFISGSGTGSNVATGVVGQISALNTSITNLNQLVSQVGFGQPMPSVTFLLNGKTVTIRNPDPEMTLLTYLRNYTPYTATKQGCKQGGCGICTVMLSYKDFDNTYVNVSANSCLLKLVNVNGMAITTNEALGTKKAPHPIQETFAKVGAFQCGYCTSAHVMQIYTSFQTQTSQSNFGLTPSFANSEVNLQGNLCRCTSSRPIIEAYKTIMVNATGAAFSPYIDPSNAKQVDEYNALYTRWYATTGDNATLRRCTLYNPANDTKNALNYATVATPLTHPTTASTFYSQLGYTQVNAASITDVANAVILAGGDTSKIMIANGETSFGVPGYELPSGITTVINVQNISGLHSLSVNSTTASFGAGVKIQKLYKALKNSGNANFARIADHIHKISGYQVRNIGTWVGGVMMAKKGVNGGSLLGQDRYFASDMALIMQAAGLTINFTVFNGLTYTAYSNVRLDTFMQTSYSGLVFITDANLTIPTTSTFKSYRVANRKFNAHAQAHMAILTTSADSVTIDSAYVLLGALGEEITGQYASYVRFTALETYLTGKTFSALNIVSMNALVDTLLATLHVPIENAAMTAADQKTYKQQLVKGMLTQWTADVKGNTTFTTSITKDTGFGTYYFVNPTGPIHESLSKNLYPTDSAVSKYKALPLAKATGEAKYNSDTQVNGQLHLALIFGGRNDAKWFNWTFTGGYSLAWDAIPVQKIDYASATTINAISNARNTSGVKLVITYADYQPNYVQSMNFTEATMPIFSILAQVWDSNFANGVNIGQYKTSFLRDDIRNSFFLSDYLLYAGQPIGFVVAETPELAQHTAKQIANSIAYVDPASIGRSAVQPKLFLDANNLANNKLFDRQVLNWGGNCNNNHNLVGNYAGTTGSAALASTVAAFNAYGGTGVGVFSTQYAASANKSTGAYLMGNVDHLCMNRVTVTTKIDNNGRRTLITDTQNSADVLKNMQDQFVFGQFRLADGKYYYSPSGPAKNANGTDVYNAADWDIESGIVGGNFGQKFGTSPMQLAAILATNILNAPVHGESDWVTDMGDNGGNTDTAVQYQLGFDNKGKVTALSMKQYYDMGAAVQNNNYNTVVNLGSTEAVDQTYNWGAFEHLANAVFTNKPASQALRAVHWLDGNMMNAKMLDLVSNGLKVKYGSTGASQFDVHIKNLISRESPFVSPTGSAFGISYKGLPVDNLGQSQISPFSVGDSGWQSGVYSFDWTSPSGATCPMYTATELVQAIDRKVNDAYFTTGAKSFFYPNGYTGSPLAAPSYVAAYDDTNARYPAIKALEALVNQYNASTGNRFNKLGLSVYSGQYMTTSGYALNMTTKLEVGQNGNVKVMTAGVESGQDAYGKLQEVVANKLLCSYDNILIEADKNNQTTAGLNSGGSIVSAQILRAANMACDSLLEKCLDYINYDINKYINNDYLNFKMTNVFAPTGSYNIPAFTGAIPNQPFYGTFNSVSELPQIGAIPPTSTGPNYLVILSTGAGYPNGWDGKIYQYVGTGAGTIGPASNPTGYIDLGFAFQSNVQGIAFATANGGHEQYTSLPTADDVKWCKQNKDLALLTIVRYAQQKTAGNAGTGAYQGPALDYFTGWNNLTASQKRDLVSYWWPKAMNGLQAGAPSVDILGLTDYTGEQRAQIESMGWFFGSPIRTLSSEGQAFESTVSPWTTIGLGIFEPFYYVRAFTSALSLVQVNCLDGTWNEIHAIPAIDLGKTLNPLTDSSQLEGGYLMGRSAFTLEQKLWHQTGGVNVNYATWEYKPNCSGDVPTKMDTIILNNPASLPPSAAYPNQYLMVGEVGMSCAAAAPSAIRQAIQAYRSQPIFGAGGNAPLDTTTDQVQYWMDKVAQFPLTNMRIKNATPMPTNYTI